jgi:hypothetical protein
MEEGVGQRATDALLDGTNSEQRGPLTPLVMSRSAMKKAGLLGVQTAHDWRPSRSPAHHHCVAVMVRMCAAVLGDSMTSMPFARMSAPVDVPRNPVSTE